MEKQIRRVVTFVLAALLIVFFGSEAFAQGVRPVEGQNFWRFTENCPEGKICVHVGKVDISTPELAKALGITSDSIRIENPLSTLALCRHGSGWKRKRIREIADRASNAVWENCPAESRYVYIIPGEKLVLSGVTFASKEQEQEALDTLRDCTTAQCAYAVLPPLAPRVHSWEFPNGSEALAAKPMSPEPSPKAAPAPSSSPTATQTSAVAAAIKAAQEKSAPATVATEKPGSGSMGWFAWLLVLVLGIAVTGLLKSRWNMRDARDEALKKLNKLQINFNQALKESEQVKSELRDVRSSIGAEELVHSCAALAKHEERIRHETREVFGNDLREQILRESEEEIARLTESLSELLRRFFPLAVLEDAVGIEGYIATLEEQLSSLNIRVQHASSEITRALGLSPETGRVPFDTVDGMKMHAEKLTDSLERLRTALVKSFEFLQETEGTLDGGGSAIELIDQVIARLQRLCEVQIEMSETNVRLLQNQSFAPDPGAMDRFLSGVDLNAQFSLPSDDEYEPLMRELGAFMQRYGSSVTISITQPMRDLLSRVATFLKGRNIMVRGESGVYALSDLLSGDGFVVNRQPSGA